MAGKYKHPVRFQKVEKVSNGIGGWKDAWTDVKTVWARIEPLRGRMLLEAQRSIPEVTSRIETRYDPALNSDMRIIHRGKVLLVEAFINVEESDFEYEIMAKDAGRYEDDEI